MPETITARDANHHFARILREVEAGKEFVVTRNGVPVARILPEPASSGTRKLTPEQEKALEESMAWARRGWPLGIERLDREAIYDEAVGIDPSGDADKA
jgi:prevent-host-death family protein